MNQRPCLILSAFSGLLVTLLAACSPNAVTPAQLGLLNPLEVNLSAQTKQTSRASFSFTNTGGSDLAYTVTIPTDAPWLNITEGNATTVQPNKTQRVRLEGSCPTTPDRLSTVITVQGVGETSSLSGSVEVTLTCTAQPSPPAPPPPPPPSPPSLMGSWSVVKGTGVFDELDENVPLTHLQLDASGSGQAFARHVRTNAQTCAPFVFSVVNASVVSFSSSQLNRDNTRLVTFSLSMDQNTLRLTDEFGGVTELTRIASIPNDNRCETANITSKPLNLPFKPSYFSSLVSDGTNLRVVDDSGTVHIVDPSTGAQIDTESLVDSVQHTQIQAMQGTDYWAHCGCGGSTDVKRVRAGVTPIKTIDSETDLGQRLFIDLGAFDEVNLWLVAFTEARKQIVVRVDSEATTPKALSQFEFASTLRGITFDGPNLWGLEDEITPKLVRIDTATGQVTRTLNLPVLKNAHYRSVAALNGTLRVMTQRFDDDSIALLTVQP